MKSIFKPIFLLWIIVLVACGDDDVPPIIPVAMFTQDRDVIETNESVQFTNSSENSDSYLWDFGDNKTSTDPNPQHSYTRRGTFVITLTTTSSTGDEAVFTSSIVVGRRWSVGLSIVSISDINSSMQPWDTDGSGPELLFGFIDASAASFAPFPIGEDILNKDLPFGGAITPSDQVVLTNTDWRFLFVDNDEPLDDPNASDIMVTFDLNPVTIESEKDYESGFGSFTFVGGPYEFIIAFEVRDE